MKEQYSNGSLSNRSIPEAWELLLFLTPSIAIIISNKPGYLFTSLINDVIGFRPFSSFPYITSFILHKNPLP